MQWSLKNKLNALTSNILKMFLFLRFKIITTKLDLSFISAPDPVIIKGNYFNIHWKTEGCYKIMVNNIRELPGNASSVLLHSKIGAAPVTITFYGIKTRIEKTLPVNLVKVKVSDTLYFEVIKEDLAFSGELYFSTRSPVSQMVYRNPYKIFLSPISSLRTYTFFSAFKKL